MSSKRKYENNMDGNEPIAKRSKAVGLNYPPTMVLVAYDKKTKTYNVPTETIKFLTSLGNRKISTVAVTGPYRSGKSYLQNNVILQVPRAQGFVVGDTVNACTKGLHISTTIIDGSSPTEGDYAILVIDTEGLNDVHASETEDARIFSLALLISNLFIYNCKNTIDQQALSNLHMVANISEHIRVSSSGGSAAENEAELSRFFPPLLWIVRDFSLELVDENNISMEQGEYLERALVSLDGVDAAKNKIRSSIRKFFPQRDCVTMVRPCADEKQIINLSDLPESELRPEFVAQAKSLRRKILTMARPKKVCGTFVTGPLMARLMQDYCKAFNQGKAPAIKDSWSLISADECHQAGAKALAAFDAHLASRELTADFNKPVSSKDLEAILVEGFCVAKDLYNMSAIGDQATPVLGELSNTLRSKADQVRRHNQAVVSDLATDAIADLDSSLMTYSDFDKFLDEILVQRKLFIGQWGLDKQPAFDAELVSRFKGWVVQFHAKLYESEAVARQTTSLLKAQIETTEKHAKKTEAEIIASRQAVAELESQISKFSHEIVALGQRRDYLQSELAAVSSVAVETEDRHRTILQGLQVQVTELQTNCADRQTQLLEATTGLVDAKTRHVELEEELTAAQTELNDLRPQMAELDRFRVHLPQLEQQIELNQASVDDLNRRLGEEAVEHQGELEKLHTQSRETISNIRKTSTELKAKVKQYDTQARADAAAVKELKLEVKRIQSALQISVKEKETISQHLDTAVSEHRAKVTQIKTEEADRAKEIQEKMEHMNHQFQTEIKTVQQKARDEYESLFTQNMTTSREAQEHKARANQAEVLLKRAEEQLILEQSKFKQGNYSERITQLEKQLASERMKADMLSTEKDRRSNQQAEDQARIRELEAKLRTIEQKHRAEMASLELRYECQLSEK